MIEIIFPLLFLALFVVIGVVIIDKTVTESTMNMLAKLCVGLLALAVLYQIFVGGGVSGLHLPCR